MSVSPLLVLLDSEQLSGGGVVRAAQQRPPVSHHLGSFIPQPNRDIPYRMRIYQSTRKIPATFVKRPLTPHCEELPLLTVLGEDSP